MNLENFLYKRYADLQNRKNICVYDKESDLVIKSKLTKEEEIELKRIRKILKEEYRRY